MGILSDRQIQREVSIVPTPPDIGTKHPGQISHGYSSYGFDARCGYKFKVFSPIHAAEIDPKNFDAKMLEEVDLTPHEHEWRFEDTDKDGWKIFKCWRCVARTSCIDRSDIWPIPNFIRIPPHSFALAETLETYTIPRDCLVVCLGKSTYARCGLIVNVTPLEPEWTGKVTLELSNTTPLPIRVYAGEGICQFLFLRSDESRESFFQAVRDNTSHAGNYGLWSDLKELNDPTKAKTSCQVSYADKSGKYQNQTGLTLPKVEGPK